MTGSLQIKNNKFYMVLNTDENGKRKNKWICTDLPVKGNKTKAQKMLRDTLRDYEQEEERRAREEIARATMPFVDAIKLWYKVKTEDFEHPIDEVTKQGYETLMDTLLLQDHTSTPEKAKIHCAEEHFIAISNGEVMYHVVDNYQELLNIVTK